MPRFEVRTVEWMREEHSELRHKTRSPAFAARGRHDAFADADAEAGRIDREAWAAPDFNPFAHGGTTLFFQTTLPAHALCDFLMDRGVDPPAAGPAATHADWTGWWAAHRPGFTPGQLEAVREALNLVRLAEVADVSPTMRTGYVVQELNWNWEDNPTLEADPEGGTFVAVYRDKAKADARCAELNAARQARDDHNGYSSFTTERRPGAAAPHRTPIAATAFFEVVAVGFDPAEVGGGS